MSVVSDGSYSLHSISKPIPVTTDRRHRRREYKAKKKNLRPEVLRQTNRPCESIRLCYAGVRHGGGGGLSTFVRVDDDDDETSDSVWR